MHNSWARAWLAAFVLLVAASAFARNQHDTLLRVEEPVMDWLLDGTDTTGWERAAALGSPWLLIPGTLILAALAAYFEKKIAIAIISTSIVGTLIGLVVRNVVDRPSPGGLEPGSSFPSLDIIQTGVFWGLVVLTAWWLGAPKLVWQVILELALVMTLLVSINLVVSGEHWPSDVVGSAIVIAIALILSAMFFEAFAPRSRRVYEPEHAAAVPVS